VEGKHPSDRSEEQQDGRGPQYQEPVARDRCKGESGGAQRNQNRIKLEQIQYGAQQNHGVDQHI